MPAKLEITPITAPKISMPLEPGKVCPPFGFRLNNICTARKQMKTTKKPFKNAVEEKCAITAPEKVPSKIPGNIFFTTPQFTAWCW